MALTLTDDEALNRDLMALVVRTQPGHFDSRLVAAFKSSLGEFRDVLETLRG